MAQEDRLTVWVDLAHSPISFQPTPASSKGRTRDFESLNRGSNPCAGTDQLFIDLPALPFCARGHFAGTVASAKCRMIVGAPRVRSHGSGPFIGVGYYQSQSSSGSWDVPVPKGDEQRFIERLKAHDERAFIELVEVYESRVFRLVFRMLGRRDEAEDMAQEVFVQVFKAIDRFRGDSKLSTWVYRIAVNLCKNRVKYLARRYADAQDELDQLADRSQFGDAKGVTYAAVERPDHMVEGYQLEQIVHFCIAQLDPDFREVLVLRDVEDLSYEEIGEITGLAEGTVKSRIHRARAMLKTSVERSFGETIR